MTPAPLPAVNPAAVGTVTMVPVTKSIIRRVATFMGDEPAWVARFLRSSGVETLPCISGIDVTIEAIVDSGKGKLDMRRWHVCQTTHCRAGWAVHLSGDAGYGLEKLLGYGIAGALIYAASRPGRIPDFYAPNATALTSIRADAAAQLAARGESAP